MQLCCRWQIVIHNVFGTKLQYQTKKTKPDTKIVADGKKRLLKRARMNYMLLFKLQSHI